MRGKKGFKAKAFVGVILKKTFQNRKRGCRPFGRSCDLAAQLTGVSATTIQKMENILENGGKDLICAVISETGYELAESIGLAK